MKDLKRKLIAALGAVTLTVTSAVSASASPTVDYLIPSEMENARLIKTMANNDPYLNITLDNGGLSTSGLKFTLKKDGKAIATMNGGMSKATITDKSLGMINITGAMYNYQFYYDVGEKGKKTVKLSSLTSEMPDAVYLENQKLTDQISGKDCTIKITPNHDIYLAYLTAKVVETKTLLPNKLVVSVSKRYAANGDPNAEVSLLNPNEYKNFKGFSDYKLNQAGDHQFDVPAGEYGLQYCNSGSFDDRDTVAYSTRQEYVKLKLPATCMEDVKKTASGLVYTRNGTNYAMSKSAGTPYASFIFRSGSVVTADVPDADGNIEIWVKKDDFKSLYFTSRYSDGGGCSYGHVAYPFRYDKVQFNTMEFPKTGVTLYNVPAGNYTVEVNDSAYQLTGNTLKVTNTQSMQKMNLKLSKKSGTTKTTTTTTTVTATKPADTTTSGSKTETTTTVPESSVPDEEVSSDTEDTSSEEESSLEDESSSENDEALSVKTIGAEIISSAEDSSSQTETSEAEKEDSGSLKTILIICGISLLALIVLIIIIIFRRKRKDQEK